MATSAFKPGLLIAAALVALDQVTKWLALTLLRPYEPVEVLPFLNLRLAFNPGAAFSFLADGDGWQRWFFVAVALAISAYLLVWLRGLPRSDWLQALGVAGVLGGAVGNMVDRLMLGVVVDFIDLHLAGWHWPTFNVADSAITVGVVLLLIGLFRESRTCRK